jgi:hypothetical protein
MLQEVTVSLGCRLVGFHELGKLPLQNWLEAACHIGLVTFISTFFLQIGGRRFLKYGIVTERLKSTIDNRSVQEDSHVMLWLLFIGGISILAGLDQVWLLQKYRKPP